MTTDPGSARMQHGKAVQAERDGCQASGRSRAERKQEQTPVILTGAQVERAEIHPETKGIWERQCNAMKSLLKCKS